MNPSTEYPRRQFIEKTILASAAGWTLSAPLVEAAERGTNLHLAPFRFDVTPPMGHSCCGGWITPVKAIDDPLEAIGFVLLGAGKPIVICAVDWTGLLNEAHVQWRTALADAAGTTPDRVAVHCVHRHDAPLACLEANRLVVAQGDLPHIVEADFFNRCLDAARKAVTTGLTKARPVTHIAHGQAKVDKVASNRRVFRDENGRIKAMRGSACRNPELVALPEGLIDPWLKTVAFYDRDTKITACHYYATHPMSYYGRGHVSSDFAGLARKRRQRDEPGCLHLYFTGCAGNIAAGKYNDGSTERRPILANRMYTGIVDSERKLKRTPISSIGWRTAELLPPVRSTLNAESLARQIATKGKHISQRNRPAYQLAWLRRVEQGIPFILSALTVNDCSLLHLPAEGFIEYQLRAQQANSSRFIATAAYGDSGPWYIPTKEEYPNGGYEVSVAFADPAVDDLLTKGIRHLVA